MPALVYTDTVQHPASDLPPARTECLEMGRSEKQVMHGARKQIGLNVSVWENPASAAQCSRAKKHVADCKISPGKTESEKKLVGAKKKKKRIKPRLLPNQSRILHNFEENDSVEGGKCGGDRRGFVPIATVTNSWRGLFLIYWSKVRGEDN